MGLVDVISMCSLFVWAVTSLVYFCVVKSGQSLTVSAPAGEFTLHENPVIVQPPNTSKNPVQAFAAMRLQRDQEAFHHPNDVVEEEIL